MADIQDIENRRKTAKAEKAEELSENNEPVSEEEGRDLFTNFLKAANYKNDEDLTKEYKVIRNGVFLFSFHIRPVSDKELEQARKAATKYGRNPNGKHYAKVATDFDAVRANSWLIYIATTDEDKKELWDNKDLQQAVSQQNGVSVDMGVELIEQVLTAFEKDAILDLIDASMNDEDVEVEPEDYAKNS